MNTIRLLISILASLQIYVQAGSVDQDPLIRQLRMNFKNSRVPTENELRFNQNWECISHKASPNDFSVMKNQIFKFYKDKDRIRTSINNHSLYFTFEKNGIVTTLPFHEPYFVFHETFRINKHGTLIGEQTLEYFNDSDSDSDSDKYYGAPSIAFEKGISHIYSYCVPTTKTLPVKKKSQTPKKPSRPQPDNESEHQPVSPRPVPPKESVDRTPDQDYACYSSGFCQADYIDNSGVTRTNSYYVNGKGSTPSSALSNLSCSGVLSMTSVSCH